MNSDRKWSDIPPEQQEKMLENARREVDRLAVGYSYPGELGNKYDTGDFFPRVVRVVDHRDRVLGIFRLIPVPPEGKWETTLDVTDSPKTTRIYTYPPDSAKWDDYRRDDGWRIVVEYLEPGKSTRGTGLVVSMHGPEERRRAGRGRLRVRRDGDGRYDFGEFIVREGKLGRALWPLGGKVHVRRLRAALNRLT